MKKHEKKLREMYGMQYINADITFEEWLIIHSESEHKKAILMSGDIGKALADIGEQEQQTKELKEDLQTFGEHLLECELSDNTEAMWHRKTADNYKPKCTCGLKQALKK